MIAQHDSTNGLLHLLYDGHGSTRAVLNPAAALVQRYTYDAYGVMLTAPGLTTAAAALTRLLYSGEHTNANGTQYLRARWYDPSTGRFNRLDPFAGNTSDPVSLHKYLYTHANPVMGVDPSGNMSLVGTMVTAGIKAGLMGMLIGSPFRAYKAAMDVYAGASFRDIASEFVMGAATDFALGAVLGGGAAGLVRQFGSNAFKIRAVGQSLGQFISARVPWSAWRLAASVRGFAIERTILNRAASFLGRQIRNFPVIDDYIMKGGRGIASSIKSLDLTLPSYANPAAVLAKLNQYADDLARFATNGPRTYSGFTVGNAANPVTDRVLVVAIEEGAATSAQANALVQWVRQAPQQFPNIRVLFQPIP